MSNQELYYLIKNDIEFYFYKNTYSKSKYINIFKKYENIINDHCYFLSSNTLLQEKIYCFLKNITKSKICPKCNKKVKFRRFSFGYNEFCSITCMNKDKKRNKKSLKKHKEDCYKTHKNKYTYYWETFINTNTKMKIKCNKCGNVFWQILGSHKAGRGCAKCLVRPQCLPMSIEDTEKAFKTQDRYNIYIPNWDTYKNTTKKMEFYCKECNNTFWQTPDHRKKGIGCPNCKKSSGEIKIENFLKYNNINYIFQYRFKDCIYKKTLPFDFFLTDLNCCVEFDGQHHYTDNVFYNTIEDLKLIQLRDKIKDNYCFVKNIKLIRIPYWDFNNIEEILMKEINISKKFCINDLF